MKKTLGRAEDVTEVAARLEALTGEERSLWGRMNVAEMVCHVREAFRAVTEGRTLTAGEKLPLPPKVVKWIALEAPVKWRPGIKTAKELETGQAGTVPEEFRRDRDGAVKALREFSASAEAGVHPFFGEMCAKDWLRWGYLHADHHLRQFGR